MVNGYIKQIIQNQERKNRKHKNFFVCKNHHRGFAKNTYVLYTGRSERYE